MSIPPKKTCRLCHKAKPLELFHRLHGSAALHPFCNSCLGSTVQQRFKERAVKRRVNKKECAQCAQELPLQMFHWLTASGTHHSYCRACHAAYMADRYRRLLAKRRSL